MNSFITSLFAIHAITANGSQQLLQQQASQLQSLNNPSYQTVMECVLANSDPTHNFKMTYVAERVEKISFGEAFAGYNIAVAQLYIGGAVGRHYSLYYLYIGGAIPESPSKEFAVKIIETSEAIINIGGDKGYKLIFASLSCGPCIAFDTCNLQCHASENICANSELKCGTSNTCQIDCQQPSSCTDSSISAPSSTILTVNCDHSNGCEGTTVNVGNNADLIINCNGIENSCQNSTINAQNASDVSINCNGDKSCTAMVVNCGSGVCSINCANTAGHVCNGLELTCGVMGQCIIDCSGPIDSFKCSQSSLQNINTNMAQTFQCIGSSTQCLGAPVSYTNPTISSSTNPTTNPTKSPNINPISISDPTVMSNDIKTNIFVADNKSDKKTNMYIVVAISICMTFCMCAICSYFIFKSLKYYYIWIHKPDQKPPSNADAIRDSRWEIEPQSEMTPKSNKMAHIIAVGSYNWYGTEEKKEVRPYDLVDTNDGEMFIGLPHKEKEEGHWENKKRNSIELNCDTTLEKFKQLDLQ